MRILTWLIGLPIAAVVVVFALSNRHTVTLGLWPFADELAVTAYLAVLLPLLAGIVVGWILASAATLRARGRAKTLTRRVEQLERELAAAKQSAAPSDAVEPPHAGLPLPP